MSRVAVVGRLCLVGGLLLAALSTACKDSPTVPLRPPQDTSQTKPEHWIPEGVYEFTVTGIGTNDMQATARRVDGPGQEIRFAPGVYGDMAPVADNGLWYEQASTGSFIEGRRDQGGYRYVTITYRLRNDTGSPLTNLTLIPCIATGTLDGTPWVSMRKFDGTSVSDPTTMAQNTIPTGAVGLGQDINLQSLYPDVIQVLTEAEVAAIPLPDGVTSLLPYGFMVRNNLNPANRTIPAKADDNDFTGVVTFGVRIPLTSAANTDAFSFTFWVTAYQDSETRITETTEEAFDSAAVTRLRARAAALGVTTTTVLGGSPALDATVPDYPGQRQVCWVRTAGTAAAPITFMNHEGPYSQVTLLWPGESIDPCAPYFRAGTPDRPATGTPFQVDLRAMDRYGNVKTTITDTVSLQQAPGGPPVTLPSPTQFVNGAAALSVTYTSYGASTLIAVAKRVRGERSLDVYGTTRTWTGGAGTSNWNTGNNWEGGAVPMNSDSVYIPASAPVMPVLTSDVQIWGVNVENGATLGLSTFNLQAAGNVFTGSTGGITGTTGTLYLAGTSKYVEGVVPNVDITGTYSLSGNLAARAPLTLDGPGRLTDSGYRLMVTSY